MGRKPKCNLKEFKDLVKTTIKADMEGIFTYKPMFLEGPGGIGKTSSIYQLHKELEEETGIKFGFYQFDVGTRTANDLWGIPYPVETQGKRELEWIKEGEFPTKSNPKTEKYGIFFITELTSVQDEQMKVGLLDLLSNRRMVGYELPDNWYIVADGNRRQDGNIYEPLTFPVRNRMSIMEVEFDKNTWLDWAKDKIHPKVVEFIRTRATEEEYITFDATKETSYGKDFEDNYVCATPRSWEAVSNILYMNEKVGMTEKELKLLLCSTVGEDVGTTFSDFLKSGIKTAKVGNINTNRILKDILETDWMNNNPDRELPKISDKMLTGLVNLISQDKLTEAQRNNVIYYILYNEVNGFDVPDMTKILIDDKIVEDILKDSIRKNNLTLTKNLSLNRGGELTWN